MVVVVGEGLVCQSTQARLLFFPLVISLGWYPYLLFFMRINLWLSFPIPGKTWPKGWDPMLPNQIQSFESLKSIFFPPQVFEQSMFLFSPRELRRRLLDAPQGLGRRDRQEEGDFQGKGVLEKKVYNWALMCLESSVNGVFHAFFHAFLPRRMCLK